MTKNNTKMTSIIVITFMAVLILVPMNTNAFATHGNAVWGTNTDQSIEDGTTYTDQTDANLSWISENSGKLFLDATNDYLTTQKPSETGCPIATGCVDSMYYDLGALQSQSFVLRLPFVANTITHGAEGSNPLHDMLRIGMSDVPDLLSATKSGILVNYELTPWQSDGFKLLVYDGSHTTTWVDAGGNEKLTSGNDYCLEIRNDAITNIAYLDLYSSSDCSGSLQHSLSQSHSGINGLRYLVMESNYLSYSSTYDIDWDNLELFVGISETSQITIEELELEIAALTDTVTSLNTIVNQQQQDIDYLYTIWEQVRDTIINWLAVRP